MFLIFWVLVFFVCQVVDTTYAKFVSHRSRCLVLVISAPVRQVPTFKPRPSDSLQLARPEMGQLGLHF